MNGTMIRKVFRGWRWKVGCVTLLLACASATAWIRSYYHFDVCVVQSPWAVCALMSNSDGAGFSIISPSEPMEVPFGVIWPQSIGGAKEEPLCREGFDWYTDFCGITLAVDTEPDQVLRIIVVPLAMLTIATTLASAWFLLSVSQGGPTACSRAVGSRSDMM